MGEKIRILHVIDSLGIAGGSERQLLRNILALDPARFENFVCYLKPSNHLVEPLTNHGVYPVYLGVKGKLQWLPSIYRLRRFIISRKIHLVHTSLSDSDLLGGIAARLSGVPVISTLTTSADDTLRLKHEANLSRSKVLAYRFLNRMVQQLCCTYFIAVSEYVKDSWMQRLGIPKDRTAVIPRAINRDWLQPEPSSLIDKIRSELLLDNSYPILLNVGRLVPAKGQAYLLEAMPGILAKFPKAKLLIAGWGPLRSDLERLSKELRLEEAVSFLGHSTQVKQLLQMCDLFAFPSIWEGFPGALLEAAAMGKPCIASDAGPIREIIQDGQSGVLVNPCSPQDLVEAVLRLSSDKEEAQALGQRAHDIVASRFVIDKTIKELEAVYTRVLE